MYKKDLALNNLQWLICHKTQKNENKIYLYKMLMSVFIKEEKLTL